MVIYKIKFEQTEAIYIGSAMDFHKRKLHHLNQLRRKTHCNIHLQRCYSKYGISSISFEVLEEVHKKEDLIPREQFWIDKFEWKQLINICPTAGNTLGRYHNNETKRKISHNHHDVSGINNPMFGLTGSLSPNYGRKQSDETKRKISEATKGNQNFLGHKHTDEAKRKIGENWKGRKHTEKSKTKMSDARKALMQKNGGPKINMEIAREIRRRRKEGETITSLAKEYGIARTYCGLVARNIYWKEKA